MRFRLGAVAGAPVTSALGWGRVHIRWRSTGSIPVQLRSLVARLVSTAWRDGSLRCCGVVLF
jgi:hypothetical protein